MADGVWSTLGNFSAVGSSGRCGPGLPKTWRMGWGVAGPALRTMRRSRAAKGCRERQESGDPDGNVGEGRCAEARDEELKDAERKEVGGSGKDEDR